MKTSRQALPGRNAITSLLKVTSLACAVLLAAGAEPARAERTSVEFAQTLPEGERVPFQAYIAAQSQHAARVDSYWKLVDDKRRARKRRNSRRH